MKNLFVRKLALIMLFLMLCRIGAAAGEPEIAVTNSNETGLTIEITTYGLENEIIKTETMTNANNENFVLLSIPACSYTCEIGKPKLPAIKKTIGVPQNATIEVSVLESEYEDLTLQSLNIGERIMPVLAPVMKVAGQNGVLVIDQDVYSQNALYPSQIITIENDDIMRGHRLATIEIVPIQYNPKTQTIRLYKNLKFQITFTNGDMIKTEALINQDYSPLYEDFMAQRVLNHDLFASLTKDILPLPIHYLIITHNNFQDQVANLAYWLKKKGFEVKVANQDSINPWSTTNIEIFINTQSPAPTYLLLVGDVNGSYMPAPIGASSYKVTDLYYAETNGSGYLPDMFYGRLSCENTTHITTIIDKILKYETGNLPAGWFKKDAFLAGNDNYWVSEGTHNYCTSSFMDPNGYTTYKLYEQTYGATTVDVATNVNDGRILTTMSGHGSDDGWYDGPQFTVANVNALTNGDKLTIATGHCCLANNFGYGSTCAGEAWIRKQNGGAVGYYGSCPSTYWDEDDWLQREWYEAIYADSIYEHGRFTQDGMYDGVYMGATGMKQYYYEAYHVLGDPSLDLWTDSPDSMVVSHDSLASPGDFTVTVTDNMSPTPIQDALVCAWIPNQNPQMQVAGYTDASGQVTLSIAPTNPSDTMYITATKHNRVPYQGYAIVTDLGVNDDFSEDNSSLHSISLKVNPNPFKNSLNIDYQLEHKTPVQIKIFDRSGRLVKSFDNLTNGQFSSNQIIWHGDDDFGRKVSTGIYFIRLDTQNQNRIEKAILLK